MSEQERTYSAREVAEIAGISPRVLVYWQKRGVVPAPVFRGPRGGYGPVHLLRVRAAQLLRSNYELLADLAADLDARSLDDLAALVDPPPPAPPPPSAPPVPDPVEPQTDPPQTVASVPIYATSTPAAEMPWPEMERPERWERFVVIPGLEVHVDVDAQPALRRLARAMFELGRDRLGPIEREASLGVRF